MEKKEIVTEIEIGTAIALEIATASALGIETDHGRGTVREIESGIEIEKIGSGGGIRMTMARTARRRNLARSTIAIGQEIGTTASARKRRKRRRTARARSK